MCRILILLIILNSFHDIPKATTKMISFLSTKYHLILLHNSFVSIPFYLTKCNMCSCSGFQARKAISSSKGNTSGSAIAKDENSMDIIVVSFQCKEHCHLSEVRLCLSPPWDSTYILLDPGKIVGSFFIIIIPIWTTYLLYLLCKLGRSFIMEFSEIILFALILHCHSPFF